MTREKFVVRLLDDAGELLAWSEVWAVPKPVGRGHSCPFVPERGPTTAFVITRAGFASRLSVHWCDLDLARQNALMGGPVEVAVGQVFKLSWMEPLWLVAGMKDVPLPAVTVTASTTIEVPAGFVSVGG